jgi:predicted nucleic acid-binding protein
LTKQKGTCGLIIDAWFAGLIQVCLSDALAYEYISVLSHKLSPVRWQRAQTAIRTLFDRADFIPIYYSWRPVSPDPGDDMVVDCAMNANAITITWNKKDFRTAEKYLGLQVMTPLELVAWLAELAEQGD